MGECLQIAHPVFQIKVGHLLRIDRVGDRHVGIHLHALLGVEAHLLIDRVTLVQIAGPFHSLHVGGELDDLAAQRAVEDPSGADWDLRRPALTAGEQYLDAGVARADAGKRRDVIEENKEHNQHPNADRTDLEKLFHRQLAIGTGVRPSRGLYLTKQRHDDLHKRTISKGRRTTSRISTAVPSYTARSLGRFSRWKDSTRIS